ncbi:SDR family NAD(P)-dependent oxidoreductase [Aeromicrobium sp. HA]|uniref:SDR family NAD(P)-dependent oxidoreductase n=1 Tax=Aeromicrobium sp. HA TaxID=3009077 RepID=UPI0022AFC645|nr:glucose 1-dehydrogenase [Aeromicrobium sp. HA]
MTGRVVIVTGASSGFGERFTRVLHEAGASVVMAARRVDRLRALEEELNGSLAVACDVTSDEQCRDLVEATVARHGRVDVLVNNAGTSNIAPVAEETAEQFRHVVDVNLMGTYSTSRYAGLQMLEQGHGVIVNIASIVGMVGLGRMPQGSYAASKAAVVNLTREMAAQWARKGVRVNAIAPAFFPTELTSELFDGGSGEAWVAKMTPMGRGGAAHELDGALLYLASDASSYVTGTVLPVDGGWTAV